MKNKEKIVGSALILAFCIVFYVVGVYTSKNEILSKSEFINNEFYGALDEGELKDDAEVIDKEDSDLLKEEKEEKIVVDIDGEINNPGVYELGAESRLVDLIQLAGGLKSEAKKIGINKAERLRDGAYYYIPKEGEEDTVMPSEPSFSENVSKKVNINIATLEELMALPGVGEVKGNAIIKYREKVGSFKSVDELGNVTGIGDKTLEKLRELVDIN